MDGRQLVTLEVRPWRGVARHGRVGRDQFQENTEGISWTYGVDCPLP
jgi:hypothetical protein